MTNDQRPRNRSRRRRWPASARGAGDMPGDIYVLAAGVSGGQGDYSATPMANVSDYYGPAPTPTAPPPPSAGTMCAAAI